MSQLAQTRPRSIAEIIDASFGFYRARFGDLLVVSALLIVPPVLLAALAPDGIGLVIRFIGNLMYIAGQGAIAILVAAAIERNETISAGEVFRRLGRKWITVILVSISAGLMMFIGFVLLIIPAFIALAWTAAAVPVAAIEGLSSGDSIARSRALARGRIGHILGTMLLVWLILFLLFIGAALVLGIVVAMLHVPTSFVTLLVQLVMVPVFPLVGVVATMLYYDLRVRSDGADVAAMIDALPATPAQSA